MTNQCQYAGWSAGRSRGPTKKRSVHTYAGRAVLAVAREGDRAADKYASTAQCIANEVSTCH